MVVLVVVAAAWFENVPVALCRSFVVVGTEMDAVDIVDAAVNGAGAVKEVAVDCAAVEEVVVDCAEFAAVAISTSPLCSLPSSVGSSKSPSTPTKARTVGSTPTPIALRACSMAACWS